MYSHSTDHTAQMTCVHWFKGPEGSRRVVRRKTSLHPRVMSHPLLHGTLSTSSPSLSSTSPVLLSTSSPNPDLLSTYPIFHCGDPRQNGTSTEYHSSTGSESTGRSTLWRRFDERTSSCLSHLAKLVERDDGPKYNLSGPREAGDVQPTRTRVWSQ